MRPPWPRLALRSLVRGGPAGSGCGLGWPRHEWPGAAKLLNQLHSVAFRCFSHPPNPQSLALSQRRRDLNLRGNDSWRVNDAYSQCKGCCGGGAMGVCRPVAFRVPGRAREESRACVTYQNGVRSAGEIAVIASSLNRTKVVRCGTRCGGLRVVEQRRGHRLQQAEPTPIPGCPPDTTCVLQYLQ